MRWILSMILMAVVGSVSGQALHTIEPADSAGFVTVTDSNGVMRYITYDSLETLMDLGALYYTETEVDSADALRLLISDTSSMLSSYLRSADTAAMLSTFVDRTELGDTSTDIRNLIATKLDTSEQRLFIVDSVEAISSLSVSLGDLIYNNDGGGLYEIEADSVSGYTVDGVAVITMGGNYAVLQPTTEGVVEQGWFPNTMEGLRSAVDYAVESTEATKVKMINGFTMTDSITLRQGVSLVGDFIGGFSDSFAGNGTYKAGTRVYVDLKDNTKSAVFIDNSYNDGSYVYSSGVQNVRFDIISACKAAIWVDMGVSNLIENVQIYPGVNGTPTADSLQYGVYVQNGSIDVQLRDVKVSYADIGCYIGGGSLHLLYNSSFTSGETGIVSAGNSNFEIKHCWVENNDSSAMIISGTTIKIDRIYFEGNMGAATGGSVVELNDFQNVSFSNGRLSFSGTYDEIFGINDTDGGEFTLSNTQLTTVQSPIIKRVNSDVQLSITGNTGGGLADLYKYVLFKDNVVFLNNGTQPNYVSNIATREYLALNASGILMEHYNNVKDKTYESVNNTANTVGNLFEYELSSGRSAYQDAELVLSPDAYTTDTIYTQKGVGLPFSGASTSVTNSSGSSQAVSVDKPPLDFSQDFKIPGIKYLSGSSTFFNTSGILGANSGSFILNTRTDNTTTSALAKLSIVSSDTTKSADFGGGAVAAYSLEPITSGYTGDVITVTRSSDNATQSFDSTEIADGTLATFVGTGNIGYVTTFIDQIDTFDLEQSSTGSAMIIYRGDSIVTANGKPALAFIDDFYRNEYLQTSSLSSTSVLVANINSGNTFSGIFDSYDNTGDRITVFTGSSVADIRIVASDVWVGGYTTMLNSTKPFVFVTHSNSTNAIVRYNGDQKGSISTPAGFNYDGITLFNLAIGISGVRTSTGFLQELIIYDEDLSSDMVALENSINDRYSLSNDIQPITQDSIYIYKDADSLYATSGGQTTSIDAYSSSEEINIGVGYDADSIILYGNSGTRKKITVGHTQAYNRFEIAPDATIWLYKLLMYDFKLEDEEIKILSR